ncbi:MAG: MATE family efflux transporter [Lachnospiraceae bacterium]|nr:MATE family efflux transporter [Lachnospiraceae bacterium]
MGLIGKVKALFGTDALLGGREAVGEIPPAQELYRRFLRLAGPSVVEAVLVALVGIVDTIMVSTLGDLAIDAVGISTQPKFVILCFIFALSTGTTAVVARRKGQADRNGANAVLRNVFVIGLGLILLLTWFGRRYAEPFLRFAGAHDSYIEDAIVYFRIICVSLVFQGMNILINAAQKGSGNTKISMTTNLVGNLVNILFNWLLINGIGPFPRLEVRGAAIATLIGAVCACMISVVRLFIRKHYLNIFVNAGAKLSFPVLKPVLNVSSSALVEQLIMRFGFFTFNMVVARLDPLSYATHIICMNFMSLSFCFGDGFQVAATALAGQSLGAKRPDLAYIYCGIGRRIVAVVATVLSIFFITTRFALMRLYTDTPEIIEMGGVCLLILSVITYTQTAQVICTGCLRGAGDTRYTAMISLIAIGIIRPLAGYVFAYVVGWGLYGAWFGTLLDQTLRMVLSSDRVRRGKWLEIQL